jgi:hypothetical protein
MLWIWQFHEKAERAARGIDQAVNDLDPSAVTAADGCFGKDVERHNRGIRMATIKQDRKLQRMLGFAGDAN